MTANDLPNGTVADAPLSFDDGVDSIANLLDPTPDPAEEDESNEADTDDTQEAEEENSDAESVDDVEDIADEDVEDDEEEQGSAIAPDDMVVALEDGTQITVAELKRNNLYQRDYTKKTTELANERKQFSEQKSSFEKAAQTLTEHRDFILRWYEQNRPQPPDIDMVNPNSPNFDPVGYQFHKANYDVQVAEWNNLRNVAKAEQDRQTAELQGQVQDLLKQERTKLLEKMPDLKDPAKFQAFRADALKFGTELYDFTPDEINSVSDSRYLRVLRKAIAYDKLQAKAPKAKEAIQGKPKLIKSGKRSSQQDKTTQSAKARADRLAKTGSFDAGVASLMDLDL